MNKPYMSNSHMNIKLFFMNAIKMAKEALSELGQAWRDDWSNFDGRTLKSQLWDISDMLDSHGMSIEDFRKSHNLCPFGGGHWTEYCNEYCGPEDNNLDSASFGDSCPCDN